jgi:Phage integrase, N-terminal SAM-like domain
MNVLAPSQPPRLMDQVRQVARLKHFSLSTEKSYLYYIHDFILFHNKQHPKEMGVVEIRAYLAHLAIAKNVAASTQNVALSALLFLYKHVLFLNLPYINNIERARRPARLPIEIASASFKTIIRLLHDKLEHHRIVDTGFDTSVIACRTSHNDDLALEYRCDRQTSSVQESLDMPQSKVFQAARASQFPRQHHCPASDG